MPPGSLRRLAQLLRYYPKAQMLRRAEMIARRAWLRLTRGGRFARPGPILPTRANPGFASIVDRQLALRGEESSARAEAILNGRFCFLNEERRFDESIDWRPADASPLWRFHLHYQDYLLDLAREGLRAEGGPFVARAWDLAMEWLAGNPLDANVHGDAWHPYCISRRLCSWLVLWNAEAPPAPRVATLSQGIFAQARFLHAHLERDLRGNHLFENARALVMVGSFLQGAEPERWRRCGCRLIDHELQYQILPHGEHYERSPMYHCQVLAGLLDVIDCVAPLDAPLASRWKKVATGMASFLRRLLHPDGQIPLLGDSAFDETPSPGVLLEAADPADGSPREGASAQGGYWTFRDKDSFLLLDAAPVGADDLPAHAHADLLTIEASSLGKRLFVDSGVFNYQADDMRRYCRSTAAHNTLQVDQADQCEMWSRFRMGYRGWPFGFKTGATSGFEWVYARHNAYRRLGVAWVSRWLACRPGGPWLCVDQAVGAGEHTLSHRLHLHPDVRVELQDNSIVTLLLDDHAFKLQFLVAGKLDVQETWYCPEFGVKRPKQTLCWSTRERLPALCAWALTWDDRPGRAEFIERDDRRLLCWQDDIAAPVPLYSFHANPR